jgi:alpha-D-ribose 1-methylphosphonate 5-phosphate C-P lyase
MDDGLLSLRQRTDEDYQDVRFADAPSTHQKFGHPRMSVENRDYHQLSQFEIGRDKRIYQPLSGQDISGTLSR